MAHALRCVLDVQIGRRLLHGVEHDAGSFGIDAFVNEGIDHLEERYLDRVYVLGKRQVERLVGGQGSGTGHVEAASAKVEVKITVVAATKCGRLTVNAIFLEMVTGT